MLVTNGAFQLDASIKSKRWSYVPAVTPNGKPVKVGVVVATPARPTPGVAVQQWIWAAVTVPSKPEKFD